MNPKNYRDLEVWQLSMELAEEVYTVTSGFPSSELYGLTSQIRRSAVSIPSNTAEGSGRRGKDYVRFVMIALGSLFELETQIELARRLNYIDNPTASRILQTTSSIAQMLNKLRSSLLSRYS